MVHASLVCPVDTHTAMNSLHQDYVNLWDIVVEALEEDEAMLVALE